MMTTRLARAARVSLHILCIIVCAVGTKAIPIQPPRSPTPDSGLFGQAPGTSSPAAVPLVSVNVQAEVQDFLSQVRVNQTYRNTHDADIEAVYHFPLDEAAAVHGFRAFYEDGAVLNGVVKQKSEAMEEYQRAMRDGRQTQLLESIRDDIFTMRVGRVPPNSLITIEISYVTLLKSEGSASRFLLPTNIAPRYSPAADPSASAVPMVSSTFKPEHGFDVHVTFKTQSDIVKLSSPSHSSEIVARINGSTAEALWQNATMQRDLIILCEERRPHQPRVSVEKGKDGSIAGVVTVFPELDLPEQAREVVFVVDRSGSMRRRGRDGQTQMGSAREALLLLLRALPVSSTFNIISFGSSHTSLFPTSQPYSEATLDQATRHVASMEADMGGTAIKAPLERALRSENASSGSQRQVFVLTDGQVANERQVLELVREQCAGGAARTFSVGIGGGVSHYLVNGIARAGRGTAAFVSGWESSSEALRMTMLAQLKQALQPSIDNVSISWNFPLRPDSNVDGSTLLRPSASAADKGSSPPASLQPKMFPPHAPPVFNRESFMSFAFLADPNSELPTSVSVSASTPDGPWAAELAIAPQDVVDGEMVHKLAARAAIRGFEESTRGDEEAIGGDEESGLEGSGVSQGEARRLALQHSLASAQTSFVAVRNNPIGAQGGVQQVVIPQGVDGMDDWWGEEDGAEGASALRSSAMRTEPEDLVLLDVTPLSVGVETEHGIVKILRRNSVIPTRKTATFTTVCDNQTTVLVKLYEGERPLSRDCRALCEFELADIAPAARGVPEIEVTVDIDVNAVLHVVARDRSTGTTAERTLADRRGATQEEIESMLADAHAFMDEDERTAVNVDGRAPAHCEPGMGSRRLALHSSERVPASTCDRPASCPSADPKPTISTTLPQRKLTSAQGEGGGERGGGSGPGREEEGERGEGFPGAASVFSLCMLQGADGSFHRSETLAELLGLSLAELDQATRQTLSSESPQTQADDATSGTLAALAAMRFRFPAQKSAYELTEKKALAYLASRVGAQDVEPPALVEELLRRTVREGPDSVSP